MRSVREMVISKVLKIIIAGNGGIGKTTLVKTFCDKEFIDQIMTIGIDIHTKKVLINNQQQMLQIWDLSGQKQFRFLLEDFLKAANGIILGFDISDYKSFLNLGEWLDLIRNNVDDAPIFLIATKSDLTSDPRLLKETVKNFVIQQNLIGFIETSAKEGTNIEIPFKLLLEFMNKSAEGTVTVDFIDEIRKDQSLEIEKESHKVEVPQEITPINMNDGKKELVAEKKLMDRCPNCNSPLRDTQIKLIRSGKTTLCQNCFKIIGE